MDLNWEEYHRFNVILLTVVGLWPHSHTSLLRLQGFFASTLSITGMLCNLITFVTMDYTKALLLKNAPVICMEFAMFIKYLSYRVASDCIKAVTKNINGDWKALSCMEEIRIIEKYIEKGKYHTRSFAMIVVPPMVAVVLAPVSSVFLDIVMPLNESRTRGFPILFDTLFLDRDKDFFIIAFLFDVIMIFSGIVFLSTETLLILYVQHACALFEVTSRRIKKFLRATVAKDSKRRNHVLLITQVVEIHSRAIRHCKTVKDNLLRSYIFLLVLGTLSMSAHLSHCTETIATQDMTGFLTSSLFSVGILGYLFYVNFVLQSVLDSSIVIFDELYNSHWYEFPPTTQKLVLFCMLNTIKPVTMDFSTIFNPSYESFTTVLKVAMSYVTALNSFK